jgi:hypothetical protein
MPGIDDFTFLLGYTAAPFTSLCGLVMDYSTSMVTGSGAGNVSYLPNSVAAGSPYSITGINPTTGYFYSSASASGNIAVVPIGQPFTVGSRVPANSSVNLVVGGAVGTTGNLNFTLIDVTTNSNIHTCTMNWTSSSTYSLHGQNTAADACNFSLSGVSTGDALEVLYGLGTRGFEAISLIAIVPQQTDAVALPAGSTAQTPTASGQVATKGYVDAAVSAAAGVNYSAGVVPFQGVFEGASPTFSATATFGYGFSLSGSITFNKIQVDVITNDTSGANFYDIGVYSAGGTLLCHAGATAGTAFGTGGTGGTGSQAITMLTNCVLTGGTRYFLGLTGSNATLVLEGVDTAWLPTTRTVTGGTTTGGALNGSVTFPADTWVQGGGTGAIPPIVAFHN